MQCLLPQASNPVVLIVDDDPFARLQLRYCLEQEGYQIVETKNGREGLEAFIRLHPDIVLLDALMPEMDGFTCCRKLTELSEGEHTPILMITALEDQESVDQAFDAGAVDYITKPIHWAVLRQRVKRIIKQTQLQQELKAANSALHRLANLDGLTQVANRRRFNECLEQEWWRLSRENLPLALIMCDIDFFKDYNDTYGHQAGDICLQKVAQTIQKIAQRPADLVARYGGEEFVVVLPNTDLGGAKHISEQILFTVRDLCIPHSSSKVRQFVTLSVGLAIAIPNLRVPPESLLLRADKALYQAKHQGRDRLVVSSEEGS